jgi:hypothetical protein
MNLGTGIGHGLVPENSRNAVLHLNARQPVYQAPTKKNTQN